MDPNLDQRLKNIETKLDDTYRVMAKIRSSQRAVNAMKAVYWVLIILLSVGAFYFVQPYLSQLKEAYGLGDTNKDGSMSQLLQQLKDQKDN